MAASSAASDTLMMGAGLSGTTGGISEVAPGTIFFPYFGNVTALLTGDGVVIVDTSLATNGAEIVRELRKRTDLPVRTIIYTHGHIDHVTGVDAFLADAAARGDPRPTIVGHKLIARRFQRYERMAGWISRINSIQFGVPVGSSAPPKPVFTYPDLTYDDRSTVSAGDESFELTHCLGETDDHTWVRAPDRNVVCSGDFFIWTCPNVGNPWKLQRYAEGWADGLEAIAATHPDVLIPGHGPAIAGDADIQNACLDTARYLRSIAGQVVERMNSGQWLEQILREVEPPADLVQKPFLQPIYGHPKFIIQGVWRQYGGWYDGDPADFFPASTAEQAVEVVKLAGADALLARARDLQAVGDLPLACHLVDWVRKAEPANAEAVRLERDLYQARSLLESNMMSRNTFRGAAAEAEKRLTT
ncbi:MAG: alkyl sulfatase dimerization domain-containing protein [Dehalococcoidia bacterium]|jgi:glyoxylase-like metal-dependent hydrolase (beta-lactamase superfamily II)